MSLGHLQKIAIILEYLKRYNGILELKVVNGFWTVTIRNVGKDVMSLRADKDLFTALRLVRDDLGINE